MSGVDWIPTWALGGTERDARFRVVSGGRVVPDGVRNWYADPDILRAQSLLAGEAAAALAGHPALWAWDLGNENSNCTIPPDREAARRWLAATTGAIRAADPRRPSRSASTWRTWRRIGTSARRRPPRSCDFLTMHGYPIYAAWSDGPTDEHLVPFLARVTRWLGGGADVLFSEFGLPTAPRGQQAQPPFVTEDEAARYTGRVLDGLRLAGCTGAMLWCYGDYDPRIWNDPPLDEAVHERSFGLWRADGSAKPAVGVVGAFAGATCSAPPDDGWIDIDADRYWQSARRRAPAPVRPLQGGADRPGVTASPVTARSRRPRAARSVGGVPWSRCDT